MKGQGCYSTGSHLSTKSRLNVKLKINNNTVVTCFETGCIMTLQGRPRLLILAPIESAYMTSSWTSIVTLVLSCRVSEILRAFVCQKPLFQYPSSILAKILGCSPWSRLVRFGSVESEHPKLTNREIIFEDFQPM